LLPPVFEDEATLFSLAGEFVEAASLLISQPPTRVNYSIVSYYLLGHAAELLLKSYLHKQGVPISELKKDYGHDLAELVRRSSAFDVGVELPQIASLSLAYSEKRLEYRRRCQTSFPPLDALLSEVSQLQRRVFDQVAEF
jgi:hypothetical protein